MLGSTLKTLFNAFSPMLDKLGSSLESTAKEQNVDRAEIIIRNNDKGDAEMFYIGYVGPEMKYLLEYDKCGKATGKYMHYGIEGLVANLDGTAKMFAAPLKKELSKISATLVGMAEAIGAKNVVIKIYNEKEPVHTPDKKDPSKIYVTERDRAMMQYYCINEDGTTVAAIDDEGKEMKFHISYLLNLIGKE